MARVKVKIFGVVGDPVLHSLSPFMHNAAYRALNIQAKYQRFHVKSKQLEKFLQKIRSGSISGVNVTIPHKQAVMPFLDKISPGARMAGAVNTIVCNKGLLVGYNTDGDGYIHSLNAATAKKINFKKMRVTVLGAGGASLGICQTLVRHGIKSLTVLNRDFARAEALVKNIQQKYPSLKVAWGGLEVIGPRTIAATDLLINATSLGMKGQPWEDLGFLKWLHGHAVVSDIVYVPRKTQLLHRAKRLGLMTVEGWGMLLYQGALAFELFTGCKAPLEVMKRELLGRLK